jgi:hypothetical protein
MAMNPMTRTLYLATGGLCLCLAIIVCVELNLTISEVEASPSAAVGGAQDQPADSAAKVDLDARTAEILDRPLFTASRRPPPVAEATEKDDGPTGPAEPVLTSRLGGVMIGPDEEREAVFARDGDKPLAVREGDQIEGWTVASITPDGVVLTSAFGDRTIEPAFGPIGGSARPAPPAPRRNPNIPLAVPQPGPGVMRPNSGFPQNVRPGAPPNVALDPNQLRRSIAAARRNQRP